MSLWGTRNYEYYVVTRGTEKELTAVLVSFLSPLLGVAIFKANGDRQRKLIIYSGVLQLLTEEEHVLQVKVSC